MARAASSDLLRALGAAVRDLRHARGMTQERLAERAGLHTTYVSDIERGQRNVGLLNLDRLAVALSIDLPELIAEAHHRRGQ